MRKEYCMHYLIRLTDNTIVAVIMLSCPQFNKAEILLDFFKICFFCFGFLLLFFLGGGVGGLWCYFILFWLCSFFLLFF